MSFLLGLTGSIGTGKSTTAHLFSEFGCDIWDADKAVQEIYETNGPAVRAFQQYYPDMVVENRVSKMRLKQWIADDPSALKKIEQIVHPLVSDHRSAFIASSKADIIVLEIPLLFETGAEKTLDAVVCVTIDADTQKKRVLARNTMSEQEFEQIKARQMPSKEKQDLSDFVITTDKVESARAQVQTIVDTIRAKQHA